MADQQQTADTYFTDDKINNLFERVDALRRYL